MVRFPNILRRMLDVLFYGLAALVALEAAVGAIMAVRGPTCA